MKVRIGISPGRTSSAKEGLFDLVHAMEETGFDSIWLSEVLTSGGIDPFVGLAFAAGASPSVKLGTTMLLPGRNVIRLAKALSSLDVLSSGRLLVTFVPGLRESPEREAIGIAPAARGRVFDEALPFLRALLSDEQVDYTGPLGTFPPFSLSPLPVQQPLEFWLGGIAPAALERCGALGDGWLPSICDPDEARRGRIVIEESAERHARVISAEHFGVSVPYRRSGSDASLGALRGRPNADLVPIGVTATRELLARYIDAGFSKFVLRPVEPVESWKDELEDLANGVGSLQN